MFFEVRISFENNGIFGSLEEIITIDVSTEGHEFSSEFESVTHGDIFWVTRKRYDVTSFKTRELIEYRLPDFCERESIFFE